jgi:hypothetical protein
MIEMYFIKCKYCNQKYRVHFSLAGYFPQESSFVCKKCANEITMTRNNSIPYIEAKNAELLDDGPMDDYLNRTDFSDNNKEKEYIDATISPDKPLDTFSLLPATIQTTRMACQIGHNMPLFDAYEEKIQEAKKIWEEIKTFFRVLKMNGKKEAENITSIKTIDFIRSISRISSLYIDGIWENSFVPFENLYKKYLVSGKLTDFSQEIKASKTDWMERIFNTNEAYFSQEREFEKILIFQKCGVEIPNTKIHCHWNNIKKVYADIYEVVGNMFALPSVINNLENGRRWNEFENIKWEKYLEIDMNGKGKNFKNNTDLVSLLIGYDNNLRNAPSHSASRFDAINSIIILNCGKGGKRIEKIPLQIFMAKTNEIFAVFQTLSLKFIRDMIL